MKNRFLGKIDIPVTLMVLMVPFLVSSVAYHSQENEPAYNTWTIEIVDSVGAVGRCSSQAIDSSGRIHVGYVDSTNENLKYAFFNGTEWVNETVDNSGKAWSGISLRVDSSDKSHISYIDLDFNLKYAYWTGSFWSKEFVVSTGAPTGTGADTSLALDSSDNPHILYINSDTGEVIYASKSGGWSFETVDTPGNAYWVSLALNSSDNPHVAYTLAGDIDLKYARKIGGSWINETVDFIGDVGWMPSLGLNSTDRPRVAYWDIGNGALKYAEKHGNSWVLETVDTHESSGSYPSLQVDSLGNPGIAYHESNKRDLRYAYKSEGAWEVEAVDTEGSVGYTPSLAFHSQDRPAISYYDNTKADLKYAWGSPRTLPDLQVRDSDLRSSPESPVANGSVVHLYATIHNIGTANASDVLVRFYDGNPSPENQIGTDQSVANLLPGSDSACSVDWIASSTGLHTITVEVDPLDSITELNETNNMGFLEVAVLSPYPSPPVGLGAHLGGVGFRDVILSWNLSADDGGGENSVLGYRILRGEYYNRNGSGYVYRDWVSNGVSDFIDVSAGEGNPNSYFYIVCAENLFGNYSCTEIQAGKFTRNLSMGNHLLSIPLILDNTSIRAALQTVSNDAVWIYDALDEAEHWKSHHPYKSYDEPFNLDHTRGFWVNVTRPSNLTVAGRVPAQTTIHLYQGWNLVSFPSVNTSFTVADVKASLPVERVEGFDPAPPYFLRVLSDSDVLLAGRACWVRVRADVEWIITFN